MKILGIDYGRAKVGLAVAEGALAEPWKVVRVTSMEDALRKVASAFAEVFDPEAQTRRASADKQVEKIIVGVSEGEMGQEQESFAQALGKKINIPVKTWDETLSTKEAQQQAIEGGVPKKKRRTLEDAFAATVMLQSYLENHGEDTPSV